MERGPTVQSAQDIARIASYPYFIGFVGNQCWGCGKTVNLIADSAPGWTCDCGRYVLRATHEEQRCHKIPDMGPSRADIRAGYELAMILRIVCSERTEPYWFEENLSAAV